MAAWPRLKLLSSIVSVAMGLQSQKLEALEIGFWCFLLLLGINALYPSILILLPEWRLARLAAASMDAVLDLGYTLTYIAIVLAALPAVSFQTSVFGNFGDEDLMISNGLTPTFAFPSNALGFAAVYVSLAHVWQSAAPWSVGKMVWPITVQEKGKDVLTLATVDSRDCALFSFLVSTQLFYSW